MLTTDYYITKKSDIFFFYQIIDYTKAKSILDMGMFFERVGAVSRQIGDAELHEDMVVDGLCTDSEGVLPVYTAIYDNIYLLKNLASAKPNNEHNLTGNKRQLNASISIISGNLGRSYDIVILLRGAGIMDKNGIRSGIRKASDRTKYMALDYESFRLYDKSIVGYRALQEIKVEDEKYLLLEF